MLLQALALMPFVPAAHGDEVLLVADMEGEVEWKAFPVEGPLTPAVQRTSTTAASGAYSLRYEFQADGQTRSSLVFPFSQPLDGFNVLTFDFYCERHSGADLYVNVHPEGDDDPARRLAGYQARLSLADGRDGWTRVRLVKDRSLRFRGGEDRQENWNRPRAISFSLGARGQGRVVLYLDNIHFRRMDPDAFRNLLYNGSFEAAINEDSPDGWRRDFAAPPFGPEVWRLDDTTAWHGTRSLRLGHPGLRAYAWSRFVNLTTDLAYTFSVYLKADRPGLRAELEVNGLERADQRREVIVGTDWERHTLTGAAFRSRTSVVVRQLSEGVLWVDAAQLEEGREATAFRAVADADAVGPSESGATAAPPGPLNATPRRARFMRTETPIRLDGHLDEPAWQQAAPIDGFVQLNLDTPAEPETRAWLAYDDQALYVAVRAEEPDMDRLRRDLAEARSAWSSDLVEIFLDLNGDRTSYYHFAVNANGQRWSARNSAPRRTMTGTPEWDAAGRMLDDAWVIEARIPFTSLDPKATIGDRMGLNICRTRKWGEAREEVAYSSWSFSHGTFHQPRAFGDAAAFDFDMLAPYRLPVSSLRWSRGRASARIANQTGRPVVLSPTFFLDGLPLAAPGRIEIGDSEEAVVLAPVAIPEDGLYRLHLEASDDSGAIRLRSNPVDVRVEGASVFDLAGAEYDRYVAGEPARVRVWIEAAEDACRELRVHWEGGGRQEAFTPVPGANTWTISTDGFTPGHHVLSVELRRGSDTISRGEAGLRIIEPGPPPVRINRWGRFLDVRGAPFYSFGFFTDAMAHRVDLDTWREILQEMKDNECTAVMAYGGMGTDLPDVLGGYLDVAEEIGLGVWVEISGHFVWNAPKVQHRQDRFQDEAAALASLDRLLAMHRAHPALLGWSAFDEPGNRPDLFTGEIVAAAAARVREADPYRPFFCAHLNHMGDAAIYGPATDLAQMPFLARGGRFDRMFREFREAGLPVVTNSPCYGAAGNSAREPAIAEQRVNTWKAIIMGARGTHYYLFRPASENLWRSMGALGAEIRELAPVLLQPDERLTIEMEPADPDVFADLRRAGDAYVLLAVNASREPRTVRFDLPDIPAPGQAIPLFDSPPARLHPPHAALSVRMPPESTAFYRLIP